MKNSAEGATTKVYRDYSQADLDRAYNQNEWADNAQEMFDRWALGGRACRTNNNNYTTQPYGDGPNEWLDVFHAGGKTVHFHIHGGAWRYQSKDGCSFIAKAMQAIEVPFVVPDFGSLPQTRMPDVLKQIASALIWTYETYVQTGKAERLVVSGHSSGAHMAALLASYDFGDALPLSCIRAIVCISGAYDLEPVLLSARRQYIDLTQQEANQLSPIARIDQMNAPIHLFYGENDSPEFKRQSLEFAQALKLRKMLVACRLVAGRNHFEIADDLGDLGSTVGAYISSLLTGPAKKDGALHV
ncbi:arylformamidase [Sulfitobacter brevis]|uniref:Arylformamidase n=1 Tax=Sulfitobacter brevis TaxID=74348 RepID=A0A1I2FC13_9RHOB|nr:alpha/beta hydrolase [Sulfitobacter brevis]SFF02076.1 arylformamidase [Sulfitobacter brevis]